MINFNENYILENDLVLLRPLELEDFDVLVEYSQNEPELWKYSLIGADGAENLKTYIQTALNGRKQEREYPFIVFDKRTQKYIGSTRFYDIQPAHKMLQLGYTWYGKNYQGTGINKQSKYLLLEFAFETLDVKRVEFRAHSENHRSINAMKSIGCVVEGILRNNAIALDGSTRSSIVLSILQDEWYTSVKEQLLNKLI